MNQELDLRTPTSTKTSWQEIVARYQKPDARRAWGQIVNSFLPYFALWALMVWSLQVSYWITVPLAVIAAGFLTRIFIIFHDCGHGSFFRSPLANNVCGFVCGVLTFTPYYRWRWEHARHHATSGDLDRRGIGDIWTLTVQEYLAASRWKRCAYRLARNPVLLFAIAPIYLFLISHRISPPKAEWRARFSVWWMNLAILAMAAAMSLAFGIVPYVLIQMTILGVAGAAGVWLFYMQHQFEDVYWERGEDWDYTAAALQGSSFYKLPRGLQWFSGNIGFHHIHHLSPRIPNYNLERCHESDPIFQGVKPMTLRSSMKSLWLFLWDESSRKMVGWRELRRAASRMRVGGIGRALAAQAPAEPAPIGQSARNLAT